MILYPKIYILPNINKNTSFGQFGFDFWSLTDEMNRAFNKFFNGTLNLAWLFVTIMYTLYIPYFLKKGRGH